MSKGRSKWVASLAALSISAPLVLGQAIPAAADSTGRAVAAGVAGGAVGMMLGAAAASAARPAPPPVVIYERPAPVEYVEPVCHFERQPVFDEDGNPAGSRRVRVCD
ncbi:MAG TPA: hypothetical protein VHR44_12360 [Beijerinckiaceae bacterium]|jgi:hypothetical protein|nr:hypothetical protein [Beijerinckiaceae bacterium]